MTKTTAHEYYMPTRDGSSRPRNLSLEMTASRMSSNNNRFQAQGADTTTEAMYDHERIFQSNSPSVLDSPTSATSTSSSPTMPFSPKGKTRRTPKKVINLSKEQIEDHYCYSQPEAAKRLGVSLSTLKRRFYELNGGVQKRWPFVQLKMNEKRRSLGFILNSKNKPTKMLDPHTLHVLKLAFKQEL